MPSGPPRPGKHSVCRDVDPFWLEDGWVDIQVHPASSAFVAQLRGRTFHQADVINSRAQSFVASLEAK